ncbi:Slp family lipoprotein [Desulfosarcina sp. BuS5]|uniref:Slp family lipoprotein n=1 Tax=Desulfosarcina sp. BuS5 TaxID=933262 RepID=UPI0018DDC70D
MEFPGFYFYGEEKGKRTLPLDEIEYHYPLIMIRKIHLLRPKKEEKFYKYPYPHRYYPPWYYYPYCHLW